MDGAGRERELCPAAGVGAVAPERALRPAGAASPAWPRAAGTGPAAQQATGVEPDGHDDGVTGPEETFVSIEFAKRALRRRPLSRQMKRVLKKLHGAHPGSLPTQELHEAAEYTAPQFAGLMGAFGRRLSNTGGYDADKDFFDWCWNEDRGGWDCRIPDTVCRALEETFPKYFPAPGNGVNESGSTAESDGNPS